jgi:site-specific DNA-methyltransferase (adenine-specific)
MFVFTKGKLKTFNPIKDKKITGDFFGKNTVRNVDGTMSDRPRKEYAEYGMRTNICRMKTAGQENPCKKILHPAKMPDAMAHDHILSWSNSDDIVLDPFMGSGTTGVQALKLSRKFIGVEMAEEYYLLAKSALEAASPYTLFEIEK